MMRQRKLYSYVVQHDEGRAPNPYFGVCTLCRCKFRDGPGKPKNVVELAKKGDWIVGTGGADARKSAGHRKVVFAMQVDKKLTRGEYYDDPRFARKRPLKNGTYAQKKGDNERPKNPFERHDQFVLISRHFYYFGAKAICIPEDFPRIEKKGPGFKTSEFDPEYISRFVHWLEKNQQPGRQGEPCMKPEGARGCKLSC
ncbi:MAG TPA: hypothetical protein VMT05_12550 [Terriglobales bacterium]|jgi:hypothetical protein|nr:hypothetical protein [Terriglobales bacterium]